MTNEEKKIMEDMVNLIKEKANDADFNCVDPIEQASICLENLSEFLEERNFNFSLDMTDDGQIIYGSINPPIPDKYRELFEGSDLNDE